MWAFHMDKQAIRQAMAAMLQRFVNSLLREKLLTADSPVIELENAGWGLEHGCADRGGLCFCAGADLRSFDRLRVGWEVNHLLRTVGKMSDGSVRSSCRKKS